MSFKSYSVPPYATGLEKDMESYLIPDDAFPVLEDAYVFRKRVHRRLGNRFLGRLVDNRTDLAAKVIAVGVVTYSGTIGVIPIVPFSVYIIVESAGVPIYTYTDNGSGILSAGAGTSGTIDYITGAYTINWTVPAAGIYDVRAYWSVYTNQPVMDLSVRELITINREELIAFSPDKANRLNQNTGYFQDISYAVAPAIDTPVTWTGTDADFFWTTNYYNLFWATNNVYADRIRYYDGTIWVPGGSGGWTIFSPTINAAGTAFLRTCLILVPYKGRLIALNTIEDTPGPVTTNHFNRARWCQVGSPIAANAWHSDTPGLGGFIDAPTQEQIVSCEFFKDQLIVYFERSTWQLTYTSDRTQPFIWQQINNQFGCEATFSTVPFDKGIFAVGDKAITVSDSVNVERIDLKIPDEIFDFHNQSQGPERVHGIRDYYYQFVYWCFPSSDQDKKFPNRVLLMNYLEGAYSFYKDSYTCFGYYQRIRDLRWMDATWEWRADDDAWNSAREQADFPAIVAGNQQGFVVVVDDQAVFNGTTLYITNITQAVNAVVTSPNHNLEDGMFVKFTEVLGMTEINNLLGKVVATTTNTFTVDIDTTTFTPYSMLGLLIIYNNMDIRTKKYNPFYVESKQLRLNYLDIFIHANSAPAEISVDMYVDDNNDTPLETRILETHPLTGPTIPSDKIWKRLYVDLQGQFLQFRFYLSDNQIRDPDTFLESDKNDEFVLHAMTLWIMPIGRLFSYDMRL